MTITELTNQARALADTYDKLNTAQGQPKWQTEDYLAGFVGDIGDLAKLVMAKSGKRSGENVDAKLAHELADCLWSVLILADRLGIDLEQAYTKTMQDLQARLTA